MNQLALQLIEKEKAEKRGYLELGKCGLTPDNPQLQAVWDALSELTHLETLILSNRWYEYDKEEKKWFEEESQNNGNSNFLDKIPTALTNLVNLKKLVIAGWHSEKWKIRKLENLPQSTSILKIRYNQISKLENLPQNISQLDISGNKVRKLENLPQNISQLDISGNKISKLENLPQSISQLDIRDNQISKLENLPQNISTLDISGNRISQLENLPKNLYTLNIENNEILETENLPNKLNELNISNNQIRQIINLGCNSFFRKNGKKLYFVENTKI